ncbi:MAG TPA: hypothetical protein VGL24_02855 [Chthoniobacterales bacterium]|jgi:hypothetical protein
MSQAENKQPNRETDPEALGRALEMELIMKRASWQKMRERRGTWRALSFLFLFLVILGALLAYFFFAYAMPRPEGEKPAAERVESSR